MSVRSWSFCLVCRASLWRCTRCFERSTERSMNSRSAHHCRQREITFKNLFYYNFDFASASCCLNCVELSFSFALRECTSQKPTISPPLVCSLTLHQPMEQRRRPTVVDCASFELRLPSQHHQPSQQIPPMHRSTYYHNKISHFTMSLTFVRQQRNCSICCRWTQRIH